MQKLQAGGNTDLSMPRVTAIYISMFCGALAAYLLFSAFWGDRVLLDFHDLEGLGSSGVFAGLKKVWFIFLCGGGFTLLACLRYLNKAQGGYNPSTALAKGWWASINAGVFEELIYRWLAFFSAMMVLPFLNLITFGWVNLFYQEALVPLANWVTLDALEPQLLDQPNWVFGAAIVSASVAFRNGHRHLHFIGWVNSWFIGMIMFYLVFNYGILTAIIAHALYDMLIFTVIAMVYSWYSKPAW